MNLTSTLFSLITFHFLTLNTVFGQTGPGGVGNSTNNMIWLKADAEVYTNAGTTLATDGQTIQQWNSVSGQVYNATQTSVSSKPLYKTNIANGFPALLFDGSDDWMGISINVPETNFSQFVVFQTQANDGNGCFITITSPVSPSAGDHDRQFGLTGNKLAHRLWSDQTIVSTSNFNDNAVHIADLNVNSTSGQNIYSDGSLVASGNKTFSNFNWEAGMVLGGHNYWGYINAYIPEIIFFNTSLNDVQRMLVQNYLSAKYNFTLTSNDIYTQDNPANGNYDYDVAGIGRIDAANIHNNAKGSGILHVLNPSNLDNNEFLIWGHNNAATTASFIDLPSGVLAKIGRVWRVSETNVSGTPVDVGTIDLRWDLSSFGPLDANDLRLIIDTNNDGFFADETAISGATSLGSNIYQFAGVNAIANNARFTIGTANITTSPLPINLLNFNASINKYKEVELEWITASEHNNDFFRVEKSNDGQHWHFVTEVKGAGMSSSIKKYNVEDEYPYQGISYYRLSQTDYNKQTTFSDIISINSNSSANVKLYPNPADNLLTIQTEDNELKELTIYNSYGQSVNFSITESSTHKTVLDISNLQQGVYSLKTQRKTLQFLKL